MSIFDELIKESGNKYASKISEGTDADVESFISTGSYSLNALLSGSIHGGLPSNKVTALAGESSTGKTFFALNIVREFLNDNPEGAVFYFESESAVTTDMIAARGIDTSRFFMIPVVTIQEFRTQAVKILDRYLEVPEAERKPLFMVLDSLGMLSTEKEVTDITEGSDKRDMTRAQLIRGAFRVLTLKLGRAKVALLITNHTYDLVGAYVPTKEMGGGCLVAGTRVLTISGYKNIEDIQEGELVLTKEGEYKEVLQCHNFSEKDLLEIEFENGYKVTCTPEHKFFVDGEWIEAGNLSSGVVCEVIQQE